LVLRTDVPNGMKHFMRIQYQLQWKAIL